MNNEELVESIFNKFPFNECRNYSQDELKIVIKEYEKIIEFVEVVRTGETNSKMFSKDFQEGYKHYRLMVLNSLEERLEILKSQNYEN